MSIRACFDAATGGQAALTTPQQYERFLGDALSAGLFRPEDMPRLQQLVQPSRVAPITWSTFVLQILAEHRSKEDEALERLALGLDQQVGHFKLLNRALSDASSMLPSSDLQRLQHQARQIGQATEKCWEMMSSVEQVIGEDLRTLFWDQLTPEPGDVSARNVGNPILFQEQHAAAIARCFNEHRVRSRDFRTGPRVRVLFEGAFGIRLTLGQARHPYLTVESLCIPKQGVPYSLVKTLYNQSEAMHQLVLSPHHPLYLGIDDVTLPRVSMLYSEHVRATCLEEAIKRDGPVSVTSRLFRVWMRGVLQAMLDVVEMTTFSLQSRCITSHHVYLSTDSSIADRPGPRVLLQHLQFGEEVSADAMPGYQRGLQRDLVMRVPFLMLEVCLARSCDTQSDVYAQLEQLEPMHRAIVSACFHPVHQASLRDLLRHGVFAPP